MEQDINFTKSEANALRNITDIIIGYLNINKKDVVGTVEEEILLVFNSALHNGETQFGFSDNITQFIINLINFWYKGVGKAVYNSEALRGPAGNTFKKHYKLVPGIIKKLTYETKNLQATAR